MGVVVISDVLLEGGLTFKTYIDKRGGEWLKSEDFRGDIIYGWPHMREAQCSHNHHYHHHQVSDQVSVIFVWGKQFQKYLT